jgi:hypothetical protein
LNILVLARWDHSGAGLALAEAVTDWTEHAARQVAYEQSYLGYPVDVLSPSIAVLRALWDWCDVVNLHDSADHLVPYSWPERPTVTTYHGSEYRSRWPWYNAHDRERNRIATALNLDLAMMGPRWLPRPMPDLSYLRNNNNGAFFRVAHAPTNRQIKDTDRVIEAMDGLDGVELVLIEGVKNSECIEIKATCDLLLEEFKLGYGTNALENWAMDIPVVADAFGAIKGYMHHRLGELPFMESSLENLRDTVTLLRDNPDIYASVRDKGRAYWQTHHHPRVVADQFINICEEARDAWINQ